MCYGNFHRYRLAPEQVYPTPLADCLNVIRYVMRNAADLGIEKDKVVLVGKGRYILTISMSNLVLQEV